MRSIINYGRAMVPVFAVLVSTTTYAAPGIGLTDDDKAILQRSLLIQQQAEQHLSPEDQAIIDKTEAETISARDAIGNDESDWLERSQEILNAVEQIDSSSGNMHIQGQAESEPPDPEARRPSTRVDILVSEAMGQSELRVVTEMAMDCMARTEMPVRLVYQGVQRQDDIASFTMRQQGFLQAVNTGEIRPVPEVVIDIQPFETFSPEGMVPVAVSYREGQEPVVRQGIINPCFDPSDPINEKATEMIQASEVPMLDLIKERVDQIDWEKKKSQVKARYYARLPDPKLPPATAESARLINMDVKVLDDIIMPNGHVVARRGDVLNPLVLAPLTEQYLVINASIPEQVDWAKHYIQTNPNQHVVVMLDGAPRQKSPESFYEIETDLNREVFLLNDAIAKRFHIQRTPSLITQADEKRIRVTEVNTND